MRRFNHKFTTADSQVVSCQSGPTDYDGFHFYPKVVPEVFGLDVDFAQLQKLFGDYGQHDAPARYSPPRITGVISKVRIGNPSVSDISTSFIERQNLTMRMQLRRFTRLTNAFSKKLSHLKAAISLHFAWYNFCRVHSTLRATPAMEAGIADHVWSIQELVGSYATNCTKHAASV